MCLPGKTLRAIPRIDTGLRTGRQFIRRTRGLAYWHNPAALPAPRRALVAAGYATLLSGLKQRIQAAQLRDSFAVNRELVLLYWQIGRDILVRQGRESLGSKGN